LAGAEWRTWRHGCLLTPTPISPDLFLHLVEDALGFRAFHAGDVVLVFEQHAKRVVDRLRIERSESSSCRAVTQSSVSATPGDL
jgi:hypothetical protein